MTLLVPTTILRARLRHKEITLLAKTFGMTT